ncbi:AMP-binding protein [Sorangium sp. So ce1335]|uniref:AMP-binding protein n=1 Tax=Sorangium sp. So ce1335 TaxID=3133335 RepID=UPI003F634D8C
MRLIDDIVAMGEARPDAVMIEVLDAAPGARQSYRWREMLDAVSALRGLLIGLDREAGGGLRVGLVMANSPEWVAADLALWLGEAVEVPIPLAFSAEQARHLLEHVDVCLVDAPGQARLRAWAEAGVPAPRCVPVDVDALSGAQRGGPRDLTPCRRQDFVCKIIHTSGTTSAPKGVKIRAFGVADLVAALRRKVPPGTYARYLSIVPLSLLIEQVTGIYMTLSDGGTLVLLSPPSLLLGTPGTTAKAILPYLRLARPSAMTLPPAMVEAIDRFCHAPDAVDMRGEALFQALFGRDEPAFLGCGGAPVAPDVLSRLARRGIAVYEGYGLSENSSVATWNVPGSARIGTVGRPLDHVEVQLAADGELLLRSSSLFAGYTSADPSSCAVDAKGWLHTGDIAEIDSDGFVRITGRKKNLIITASGRNVSPAWVESRYKSLDFVEEAVIFGDRLEKIHGLFIVEERADPDAARAAIDDFGQRHLSEVERAAEIVVLKSTPELYRHCFTITGRPIRTELWKRMTLELACKENSCPA